MAKVIEEAEKPQADIDSHFEEVVKRALKPHVEEPETETKSLDDSYKSFRTRLVTLWILTNTAVAIVVTQESFDWLGPDVSPAWLLLCRNDTDSSRSPMLVQRGTSVSFLCRPPPSVSSASWVAATSWLVQLS